MWKPLTGEPCAGKPHARFGGRGGRCPFLPLFVDQLKRLAETGNWPTDKAININVVVNLQQNAPGATGTQNINNVVVTNDADLEALLKRDS